MIMKRNLLFLLLALMTSVPMLADVVINETTFPDPVFRNYVLTNTDRQHCDGSHHYPDGMSGYGTDGILTTAELSKIHWLSFRNMGISNLKGIEYFTELVYLNVYKNNIETVDLSKNTQLQYLDLSYNNLQSLDVSKLTNLRYLDLRDNSLTSINVTNLTNLKYLNIWGNQISSPDISHNANLEELDIEGINSLNISHLTNKLKTLGIRNCNLTNLDLSNFNSLVRMYVTDNNNLTSLTLPTSMADLQMENNPLLSSINLSALTALQRLCYSNCGLTSIDVSHNTALRALVCNDNQLTDLDVSNNSALQILKCNNNQLTSLDLSGNPSLGALECANNHLTELDLSQKTIPCSYYLYEVSIGMVAYCMHSDQLMAYTQYWNQGNVTNANTILSPQKLGKDYVAIDGRGKLGVQCNTNDGVLTSYGNYTALTDEGNNYIMVADETVDGKTDVHAYRDTISYSYNTGYTGDYDDAKTMEVKIATSAHGMYVHPETKTTEYTNSYNGFYWGTLYLEFPARIPDGVQCYYAKSLDVNENLANLTEVTGTIPANTAVIVKAPTEPKFFAFNENYETPAPTAPTDNIMEGTIEVLPVAKRSVLTLGFNVSNQDGEEGQFGFWDYVGTRINPFRAYVPKSNLPAGAKGGFSLLFPGDDTNGIARLTNSDTTEDGTWYTLSGMRLTAKPTAKGIYVNGGKKVVIK